MAMQKAGVDSISGATVTSSAVTRAAQKCIDQATGKIPVEVVTKKAAQEADDGDWLGKPPVIAEKDIVKTIKTEIVVVGCGTNGMFAVASAAEGGAKVIGIDRFAVGTGVREGFAPSARAIRPSGAPRSTSSTSSRSPRRPRAVTSIRGF